MRLITQASAVLFVLLALATAATAQSRKCPVPPQGLAGGYELRGVREVGSMIALTPDGQFGYMLSYGAYDEDATGCWETDGKTVTLNVKKMRVNHGNNRFRKKVLSVDSKGGLVRWEDGQRVGTYVRVERY